MFRVQSVTVLIGVMLIFLTSLAVAACGGGKAATAATAEPSSGASGTVHIQKSRLGPILVDSQGRTLYLFKGDSGTKSSCTGACAVAWPPLLASGHPTAGSGVTAAQLGTTPRAVDSRQVTYNGHPLYLYVGDKKPGALTGQGVTAFGAPWYVVSPAGNQITSRPPSSTSGTSSGGSAASGY